MALNPYLPSLLSLDFESGMVRRYERYGTSKRLSHSAKVDGQMLRDNIQREVVEEFRLLMPIETAVDLVPAGPTNAA